MKIYIARNGVDEFHVTNQKPSIREERQLHPAEGAGSGYYFVHLGRRSFGFCYEYGASLFRILGLKMIKRGQIITINVSSSKVIPVPKRVKK